MNKRLARSLLKKGRVAEAEKIYKQLSINDANDHEVYESWAALCSMQKRLDESIILLRKSLKLKPDNVTAHNNLGVALDHKGNLTAAITSYRAAIKLRPNYAAAHINLGNTLQKQGNLSAAVDCYRTAIRLRADSVEAHYNLGVVLQARGDLAAAFSSYKTALRLKPKFKEVHNNLGLILKERDNLNEAINCYRTAIQLKFNYPEAHFNLGIALKEQGDLTAAIDAYKTALQLKPNYQDADWNLSLAMLLSGDYKNGWEKYKLRTKSKDRKYQSHALPKCTPWPEEVDLRTTNQLLLVSEQGLGDTLQFMRYAITLKEHGKLISLCAQPKLHSLIQASGIDPSPLTPDQANQITEGHWIPLLSVPRHLKVSPSDPVITDPYIKTTDELHTKWTQILSAEQRPIVGINWQGNPSTEKTGLSGRSLALETFAPIVRDTQISLLSLQKGFGSEQLDTCSFKNHFVRCQNRIDKTWDFLETAAIIDNCDLIITSDTSVAHLAGGMGKNTWLLLHQVPDWRWGLTSNTSFWYPSMRLFRQKVRGNWEEVMERVTKSLRKYFKDESRHAD